MVKTQNSAEKSSKIEKTTTIRGLDDKYVPNAGKLGLSKELNTKQRGASIQTLYDILKTSPEALACIQAQVEDIMADMWRYEGSVSAANSAEEFELKSNMFKALSNGLWDMFATGDAFILKLGVDSQKIKEVLSELTKDLKKSLKIKKKEIKKEGFIEIVTQKFQKPKDLQLLKSSTVQINYDETGIVKNYEQEVNGIQRFYDPNDVIHLTITNIGGTQYGFTPMETLLSDIATLIFAKNYAGKFFENDGTPDWLFTMPESTPDDRNYKAFLSELKTFKKGKQKHRSMVVTGKVEAQQIQKFTKDLEFNQLIQHYTQLIFVGMGVPPARCNYTLNKTDDSAQTSGKVEAGYFRRISFIQKIIEGTLNRELWPLFGKVRMKFKRSYKIDEMREAQVVQIATQAGLMTIEEAREKIGLERKLPKGTMPNSVGDQSAINMRQDKKREQGTDQNVKEPPQDNQTKDISKGVEETLEVGFGHFVNIVEGIVGIGQFDKAKVFYTETAKHFILLFSDGQWKYKSKVAKEGLDIEAFRVERLSRAVPFEF